ncbi:hypothetical protein [Cupriavidus pampae]|uniref:Uncharacterized protein n=1 Tax=Cupriavidus pampae TaxID=659251 RepID=A0ABN7ZPB0_9BURK|nr:hypothetical protein [Cupriavidus pampae]CAG9185892.1 hypothetical protein LMG32289_06147 [Cupriavidus pampae]
MRSNYDMQWPARFCCLVLATLLQLLPLQGRADSLDRPEPSESRAAGPPLSQHAGIPFDGLLHIGSGPIVMPYASPYPAFLECYYHSSVRQVGAGTGTLVRYRVSTPWRFLDEPQRPISIVDSTGECNKLNLPEQKECCYEAKTADAVWM